MLCREFFSSFSFFFFLFLLTFNFNNIFCCDILLKCESYASIFQKKKKSVENATFFFIFFKIASFFFSSCTHSSIFTAQVRYTFFRIKFAAINPKTHSHRQNISTPDPADCLRPGKVQWVSRCIGHGMAVPVDAQGAADIEVVLARVVAEIEVHSATVAHTAGAFLARRVGQAHPMLTGAVWAAEVTVDFGVADPVIGTIFVGTAALSTRPVLQREQRWKRKLMLEKEKKC